jgi:hypothetical protein
MARSGKASDFLGRPWWQGVAGVVAVIALVVAIIQLFAGSPTRDPSHLGTAPNAIAGSPGPPTSAPLSPVVVRTGMERNLGDKEGIDLDSGVRDHDNAPDQDISPGGKASSFGLMATGVRFAVLPEPGPEEYQRCADLPESAWLSRPDSVSGLHQKPPGTNICIRTSSANLAMLTIDRTPDNTTGTIDLHYIVWRP